MRLSDFRVKARIYTGFAALILLAATLAAVGIWQLTTIDGQVRRLVGVSENAMRTLQVGQLVEAMRRVSLLYKTTGEERATTDFGDDQVLALDLLSKAGQTTKLEQRRQLYAAATETLKQASDNFDKLATMTKASEAERAKMLAAGDKLTSATESLLEEARQDPNPALAQRAQLVETSVLLARVESWRFLATRDPKGPAQFEVNLSIANAAVDALEKTPGADLLRDDLGDVKKAVADYNTSFTALAHQLIDSDKLYDQAMRPQFQKVDDATQSAQKSLIEDLQATKGDTDRTITTTITSQGGIAAIVLALGMAFAILIGRSIVVPVAGMTAAMKRLAGGDKTVAIPAQDYRDEIGEMAQAVGVFKESMIEAERLAGEQRAEQAQKERRQQAIEASIAEFDRSVRDQLDALGSASGQLRTTAESMSSTAAETTRQAAAVAGASEQASSNVQTVAASTEEMAASIAEITRQVTQSSEIATQAVDEAARTNVTVQGLAEAAQKIGEVVSLIQQIASQTNLLALNATIEAARAGEAGKGFAVVASEVKTLANQTGKATEDIAGQVTAIQSATKQAVDAIKGIDGVIGKINNISAAIAAAMEEQGATTREITRHTQEAARGTGDVSQNIGGVNRAANEAGAAAAQVLASSEQLGQQAETLRRQVDQFLARIRAA